MSEQRSKNWQRFDGWTAAQTFYLQNMVPACTRLPLGLGKWLYMDHIPGENRLSFLRRCLANSILTARGLAELNSLEKEAGCKT